MSYAFIAQVSFEEGTDPAFAQKMLETEVVPLVQSQAGFLKGI